jgi:hypothetical protein
MFNIWINKYGLNVVLLGHQFQFARPGVRRAIARQLREKLPAEICLSILYARQGWLKELRERVNHGWGNGDVAIRVPAPRRHGGHGRNTLARELDQLDIDFCRNGLGIFEFGGDVPTQEA